MSAVRPAVPPVSEQKRPNVRKREALLSRVWAWWAPAPLDFGITEEELWKDLRWGRK